MSSYTLLYRGDDLVQAIYEATLTRPPFLMMERNGAIHQAWSLEYRGFYPGCRTFALDTWNTGPVKYREIELVEDHTPLDVEPLKRPIKRILDV